MRIASLLQLSFMLILAMRSIVTHCPIRREKLAEAQLKDLEAKILVYNDDCGRFPGSLSELVQSRGCAGWKGPYARASSLKDPWGNPLRYAMLPFGVGFVACSLGEDGRSGGEGKDGDACVGRVR